MVSRVNQLLEKFIKSKDYWYLVPKGFWPGLNNPKGIQGFHRFLEILFFESFTTQMEILNQLSYEGFLIKYKGQTDYEAHYRNRINFAEKIGFVCRIPPGSQILTPVGQDFVFSSAEEWPKILEHQLIKLQFTNPSMKSRYSGFHLFPYIFTVNVLLHIEGNYISLDEFVLRVLLSTDQAEESDVIDWIREYRNLTDRDKTNAHNLIQSKTTRSLAARVITYLFSCTPSLEFQADTLMVRDINRARYLLAKCLPHLNYTKYPSLESWENKFGQFDKAFWPLLAESAIVRRKKHQQYIKREEGSEHKTIKKYLVDNAEAIWGKGASLFEEEYSFESGDSANLVFSLPSNQFVTVEVEVDIGEDDIAGLLQAVKYRYMFPVQTKLNIDQVKGMLIARKIHPSVKALCAQYGIEFLEINVRS